uniref:Uncharacterized protein n=1 Tax=Citrobacter freundii TaxID=546 RepID=A0A3S5I496_CITFR|nr:hypothetical protein [Citrobacter freundii]UUW42417.1 hypothetical protein [Citrobacter portucalensis]
MATYIVTGQTVAIEKHRMLAIIQRNTRQLKHISLLNPAPICAVPTRQPDDQWLMQGRQQGR